MGADKSLGRRSWERIRAYVGCLGSGSGLTRRSWAQIRAYLGGLAGGSGPMWEVLGADQSEKRPWLERESYLGRDLGRKVAQTQAGMRSGPGIRVEKEV